MTKTGKWIVAILIIMVAIPLIGIFLILINYSFATNPAPVSYTHLDVYKRQLLGQ